MYVPLGEAAGKSSWRRRRAYTENGEGREGELAGGILGAGGCAARPTADPKPGPLEDPSAALLSRLTAGPGIGTLRFNHCQKQLCALKRKHNIN